MVTQGSGQVGGKRPVFARIKSIMSSCVWGHKSPLKTSRHMSIGVLQMRKTTNAWCFFSPSWKNSTVRDYANILRFKFVLLYMCPSSGSDFPLHAWCDTTNSFWGGRKSCSSALKTSRNKNLHIHHSAQRSSNARCGNCKEAESTLHQLSDWACACVWLKYAWKALKCAPLWW